MYVYRTNDPHWGFGGVAGRCFELNEDVFIIDWRLSGPVEERFRYCIRPPAKDDPYSSMPKTIEEWRQKPRSEWQGRSSYYIGGVVVKGTRVRVTELIQEVTESGSALPFGVILDGPYRGKQVDMYEFLNDPDWPKVGTRKEWAVKEQYLLPCPD